jgi:hypothetical protein
VPLATPDSMPVSQRVEDMSQTLGNAARLNKLSTSWVNPSIAANCVPADLNTLFPLLRGYSPVRQFSP